MTDFTAAPKTDQASARGPALARKQTLLRAVVLALAALGYALLAHLSTAQGASGTFGALVAIGPLGLIALILAWRSAQPVLGLTAWALAAVLIAAHREVLEAHFVWVYLIQQVGIYFLLGLSFGRTLASGQVPLCTQMALRVRGALSADALRYTRLVTVAWTVFFGVIAAALLTLFFAAPPRVWSVFANFGAPVLVILMFAIENRVRRRLLPNMAHVGIIATLRASAATGFGSGEQRS